jgi:hypothetical protein
MRPVENSRERRDDRSTTSRPRRRQPAGAYEPTWTCGNETGLGLPPMPRRRAAHASLNLLPEATPQRNRPPPRVCRRAPPPDDRDDELCRVGLDVAPSRCRRLPLVSAACFALAGSCPLRRFVRMRRSALNIPPSSYAQRRHSVGLQVAALLVCMYTPVTSSAGHRVGAAPFFLSAPCNPARLLSWYGIA